MIREMCGLNGLQARPVEAPGGAVAIAGGPGTGKTWAMICKILLLLSQGIRPDDVVFLTPHDHRVALVRRSLEDLLEKFYARRHLLDGQDWEIDHLRQASAIAVQVRVDTVEQYACRLLRHLTRGEFSVWSDDRAIQEIARLETEMADHRRPNYKKELGSAREFFQWHVAMKTRAAAAPAMPVPVDGWRELDHLYTEEKTAQRAQDSYDLIIDAQTQAQVLAEAGNRGEGGLATHYLVDDFHGVSEPTFQFIAAFTGRQRNLTVAVDPGHPSAGDAPFSPQQWFLAYYPNAQRYILPISRRATSTTAAALERIAGHGRRADNPPYAAFRGRPVAESAVTLHVVHGRPQLEIGHAYSLISDARAHGVEYGEIVLLLPVGGRVTAMVTFLTTRGIPFGVEPGLIGPTEKDDTTQDAHRIVEALRLLAYPFDRETFRTVVSMPFGNRRRPLDSKDLDEIIAMARERGITLVAATRFATQDIARWTRAFRALTPLLTMHAALERALVAADGPDAIRELVGATREAVSNGLGRPLGPRDAAQVDLILHLSHGFHPVPGEAVIELLRRFLDRLSPALHPRSKPLEGGGFEEPGDRIALISSARATGDQWQRVIAAFGGDLRGRALAVYLYQATAIASERVTS